MGLHGRIALLALVLSVAARAFSEAREEGSENEERLSLRTRLEAGPLLGLDRGLRGLEGELSAGFVLGDLSLGAGLGLAWDAGRSACAGHWLIGLELGPCLGLSIGSALFPKEDEYRGMDGSRLGLGIMGFPSRLAMRARLSEWRLGRTLRLGLSAELAYTAYALRYFLDSKGNPFPGSAVHEAALAGFSAGFSSRLGIGLAWQRGKPEARIDTAKTGGRLAARP